MIIYLATNASPKYNLPVIKAGGHDGLLSYHYAKQYPPGMFEEFAVTGLHGPVEESVTKKFKEDNNADLSSRKRQNKPRTRRTYSRG